MAALEAVLGVRAVVKKTRTLFHVRQTRVHLDEVSGLGRFIELEVVLQPEQTEAEGAAIAQDLMSEFGLRQSDLVAEAYVDQLTEDMPNDSSEPPS